MIRPSRARVLLAVPLTAALMSGGAPDVGGHNGVEFERISTFVVCENTSCTDNAPGDTVSEIVTASEDGRILVYADSALDALGFVDIADPARPRGQGVVKLDGQPTSVTVAGPWILAAVNTSASFVSPSGRLDVFDMAACAADTSSCAKVATLDVGGQPDSVAVSPDGRYAAVVVENERDGQLVDRPREPDSVAWLGLSRFVTANEADLFGGSRGFTVFGALGGVQFDSGRGLESLAQSHGHYPEDRSENKGTEPEGVTAASFQGRELIFVGSERGNFVAVYEDLGARREPRFLQLLPTGVGPEGLLAIPRRGLFVTASETDDPIRSQLTIFRLNNRPASYPQVVSGLRADGPLAGQAPIGWVALSALAGNRLDPQTMYTAHDSFLGHSRIYTLDVATTPAVIRDELVLLKNGEPVSYDVEGLATREDGGFWVVSEGSGNAPAAGRPNLLVKVDSEGTVLEEIALPASVAALRRSNGYEGVTVTGGGASERVFVAFQREWLGDPAGFVRIGEYQPQAGEWRFFYYPLDAVESEAAGWVGLSEIVAASADKLLVLERDNAGGPDARNKRVYAVSIAGISPRPQGETFPILSKALVVDLLPALRATRGWTQEKVEGLGLSANGRLYAVTDNDGVDENTGETVFLRLGKLSTLTE